MKLLNSLAGIAAEVFRVATGRDSLRLGWWFVRTHILRTSWSVQCPASKPDVYGRIVLVPPAARRARTEFAVRPYVVKVVREAKPQPETLLFAGFATLAEAREAGRLAAEAA